MLLIIKNIILSKHFKKLDFQEHSVLNENIISGENHKKQHYEEIQIVYKNILLLERALELEKKELK